MKKQYYIASLFILVIISQGIAQKSTEKPSLADFCWLEGHWVGDGFGGISEEIWSAPVGNSMIGMYRHIKDSAVTFYEFMNIVEVEDSIYLRIKHFTPEFIGWEEKDKYITFKFESANENQLWFSGLVFRKVDAESMQIELKLRRNGIVETETFNFKRKQAN